MLIISDEKIRENLNYSGLIDALKRIFQSNYTMPLRHHHFYKTAEGADNTLILMPVWNDDFIGMKQVTVAPANADLGMPSIFARYILSNARTGEPLAMMNAAELTSRRTACTSALAADFLARKDAKNLLIVGSGKVAQHLGYAYAAIRSLETRNTEKRNTMVQELQKAGLNAHPVDNLEAAVREADIVSCATLSKTPVIFGEWIKAGTHLDMIGSHKPDTREADDAALLKSTVFVDSRMGALHETGELAIPIAEGTFAEKSVQADITELIRGEHAGRHSETEITFFKSAGLAVEDLAAALMVYEKSH
jgi:ornithine cyclodeaminase/alanine dehydrogenase-like protein (mu-crystallin family)